MRALETAIGEPLFAKKGGCRRSPMSAASYQHADDIFGIGRDLIDTLKGRQGQRAVPLTIGVRQRGP